jgi:hypothetical protein
MTQSTLSNFAINIVAGAALIVLGFVLRSARSRYSSRDWRKLWKMFLGQDLGILLTTREGPLRRSTRRVSLAETKVVTTLIPLLHSLSIRYVLLDQDEVATRSLGNWNLLVLGGPGVNEASRRITELIQVALPFSWGFEPVSVNIANRTYAPSYDPGTEKVIQDYGVIVRTLNPYDSSRKHWVLLIMGCHGFGTEGAAQVLAERRLSHELLDAVGGRPYVAIVSIRIQDGNYLVHVEETYLLPSNTGI